MFTIPKLPSVITCTCTCTCIDSKVQQNLSVYTCTCKEKPISSGHTIFLKEVSFILQDTVHDTYMS